MQFHPKIFFSVFSFFNQVRETTDQIMLLIYVFIIVFYFLSYNLGPPCVCVRLKNVKKCNKPSSTI